MNSLVLCLLALTAVCAMAKPTITSDLKQTISIKAKHVPVSVNASRHLAKSLSPYHPINLMNAVKSQKKSRPGETAVVPLLDYYQYLLIGNMTVGSPAKTFSVAFDLWSSDLSVIDVAASVDHSWDTCDDDTYDDCTYDDAVSSDLSGKQLYNASASSTSATSNGNFTSDWWDTGVMVNDNVNIGGLNASLNFGDLTTVYSWLSEYPMDGILGLSPKPSNNSGMKNLLNQLSGSLALPVLTMHLNRSTDYWRSWDDVASSTDAEIVLGTNSLPQCDANNWKSLQLNPQSADQWAPFVVNATSISSSSTGCNSHIQTAHPVWFIDGFYSMVVSYQVEELLVAASGAVFNQTSGWYTVASMANASNVNINLADGEVLTLRPEEYILTYKGINYLYVYAYYNEDDASYADYPIFISQLWLNNHCISYNINVNTLSITDAKPNNGQ